MGWWWILVVPVGLVVVGFGALQLWFVVLRLLDRRDERGIVANLARRQIPKLSSEEQFKFLDGHWDFTRIQHLLGEDRVDQRALSYFITVEPEAYLEHLRANNPPRSWPEDTYGEVFIENEDDIWRLRYFSHGRPISTVDFEDYDKLLRHLVKERLTNVSRKYKTRLKRSPVFR